MDTEESSDSQVETALVDRKLAPRKPRADAERNRLRLMTVAKEAFAEKGISASLEDIARAAGVGIGTLYRHFATREALVGQLYENEGEQLAEAAERLAQAELPIEALRQWLLLFVDYVSTKRIIIDVLSMPGSGADIICAVARDKLIDGCGKLLENVKRTGRIRRDVEPIDLLVAIGGGATLGYVSDWEKGAARLTDILIAGLTCE
ncbi:TetR/AcrR family transcriptional regulator [Sphingobium mellinum]|uniref:TetR/AcrR family transcriptional regulator n=1 Tax=Sphingobium mellinum TaxID=1387166 RepID=UPI0030EDE01D